MTKLLEKRNVDIERATRKHKNTHTAFVGALNKELGKHLLKLINAQEFKDPEKVSKMWIKQNRVELY